MHWLLGGYMWLFIHRPFEYYPALGDLQIERLYVLLMLACWLASPAKGWVPNRLHLAVAALTLALTACWLASRYRDQCGTTVENFIKVTLFYVLVVTTVRDERGLRRVLGLYLLAVGLYMAHSLLEYSNGRYEWRMGIRRMIGVDVTYHDPNAFAATLLMSLPLALPFWPKPSTWLQRLLLLVFAGSACLCILLTGSRAGFVGLAAFGLGCLLVMRRRRLLLPLAGGAGLVLVAALPGDLHNRFLTLIDPSYGPENAQVSGAGRLVGFLEGMRLWNEHPLLGVGPGAFAYASGLGYNPHNVYGQVASELGSAGALAFAGLVVCFFLNGWEARRSRQLRPGPPDFPSQVVRAVTGAVLLMLLLGCAGHNLYRYHWQWFAAFQVAALHCIRLKARAASSRRVRLPSLLGPWPGPRAKPRPAAG
jgi:O-antigen ligase